MSAGPGARQGPAGLALAGPIGLIGLIGLACLALIALPALAAPTRKHPPPQPPPPSASASPPAPASPASPPPKPPGPLSVGRVDVLFREGAALVTTDVIFARGGWQGDALEAFVAYGAPGVPSAFEASLVALEPGRLLPPVAARGTALEARHAQGKPPQASIALGPQAFAGQAVRLPAATLEEALAPSGLASLRLRAVHLLPPGSSRSILARLSSPSGPLPLGAVTVRGEGPQPRAPSAHLCSPQGKGPPLVVSGLPAPPGALPPPRAPRTAQDELCVSGG